MGTRRWTLAGHVSSLWDAVVRVWLVARVWVELRRAPRFRQLGTIRHPRRFVRAAIIQVGRQVALAIMLLPRSRRAEATISLLACKALEGIDAREAVIAAIRYLTGEAEEPPPMVTARGTGTSDRLTTLLAARLPVLRAALDELPGDAMRRCHVIIERIGEGMLVSRADQGRYADHVLGEAVICATRLAAPIVRSPDAACRAAGRALQLANEPGHGGTAKLRAQAGYRALAELPTLSWLLRWLPASVGPGTRAAATLFVATTCAATLGRTPTAIPRRMRYPLLAALAAAWSRRGYLATVSVIEDAMDNAIADAIDGGFPAVRAVRAVVQRGLARTLVPSAPDAARLPSISFAIETATHDHN